MLTTDEHHQAKQSPSLYPFLQANPKYLSLSNDTLEPPPKSIHASRSAMPIRDSSASPVISRSTPLRTQIPHDALPRATDMGTLNSRSGTPLRIPPKNINTVSTATSDNLTYDASTTPCFDKSSLNKCKMSETDSAFSGDFRRSILKVSPSPYPSQTRYPRPSVSFAKQKEIVTFNSCDHRVSSGSSGSEGSSVSLNPLVQKVFLSPLSEKPESLSSPLSSSPYPRQQTNRTSDPSVSPSRASRTDLEGLFLNTAQKHARYSSRSSNELIRSLDGISPLATESPWVLPSIDDIANRSFHAPIQVKRTSTLSAVQSPAPTYCFKERLSTSSDVEQANSPPGVSPVAQTVPTIQDADLCFNAKEVSTTPQRVVSTAGESETEKISTPSFAPSAGKVDASPPFNTPHNSFSTSQPPSPSPPSPLKNVDTRVTSNDTPTSHLLQQHNKDGFPLPLRESSPRDSELSDDSESSFPMFSESTGSSLKDNEQFHSPLAAPPMASLTSGTTYTERVQQDTFSTEARKSTLRPYVEPVTVPRLSLASLREDYPLEKNKTVFQDNYHYDTSGAKRFSMYGENEVNGSQNKTITIVSNHFDTRDEKETTHHNMPRGSLRGRNPSSHHPLNTSPHDFPSEISVGIEAQNKNFNREVPPSSTVPVFTPRTARRTIGPIKVSQGGIWERLENGADRMTPRPREFNPAEIRLSSVSSLTLGESEGTTLNAARESNAMSSRATGVSVMSPVMEEENDVEQKEKLSVKRHRRLSTKLSSGTRTSMDCLPPISLDCLETPCHFFDGDTNHDLDDELSSSNGVRVSTHMNTGQELSFKHRFSRVSSVSFSFDAELSSDLNGLSPPNPLLRENKRTSEFKHSHEHGRQLNFVSPRFGNSSNRTTTQGFNSLNCSFANEKALVRQSSGGPFVRRVGESSSNMNTIQVRHRSSEKTVTGDISRQPLMYSIVERPGSIKEPPPAAEQYLNETAMASLEKTICGTPYFSEENSDIVKLIPMFSALPLEPKNRFSEGKPDSKKAYTTIQQPTPDGLSNDTPECRLSTKHERRFDSLKVSGANPSLQQKMKDPHKRSTLLPRISSTITSHEAKSTLNINATQLDRKSGIDDKASSVVPNGIEKNTAAGKRKVLRLPETGVEWNACHAIQRMNLDAKYFTAPYPTLEKLHGNALEKVNQALPLELPDALETNDTKKSNKFFSQLCAEVSDGGQGDFSNSAVHDRDGSQRNPPFDHPEKSFTPQRVAAVIDWLERRSQSQDAMSCLSSPQLIGVLDSIRQDPELCTLILRDGIRHLLTIFTTKASVESWEEVIGFLVQFWPERFRNVEEHISRFPETRLSRYQVFLLRYRENVNLSSQQYSLFMDHIGERQELATVLALGQWKLNVSLPAHFGAFERLQATACDLHKAVEHAELIRDNLKNIRLGPIPTEPESGMRDAQETLKERLNEAIALEEKQLDRFSTRYEERKQYGEQLELSCTKIEQELQQLKRKMELSTNYIEQGQAAIQLVVLQEDVLDFEQYKAGFRLYDVELDYVELEMIPQRYQTSLLYTIWEDYLSRWVPNEEGGESTTSKAHNVVRGGHHTDFNAWVSSRKLLFEALEEAEIAEDINYVHQPENLLLQGLALPPIPRIQIWWRYEELVDADCTDSPARLLEGLKLRIRSGLSSNVTEYIPETFSKMPDNQHHAPVAFLTRRFVTDSSSTKVPVGLGPVYFDWYIRQHLYKYIECALSRRLEQDLSINGFPHVSPVQSILEDPSSKTECIPLMLFLPGIGMDKVIALGALTTLHYRQIEKLMAQHRYLYLKYHPMGLWGPESTYLASKSPVLDVRLDSTVDMTHPFNAPLSFSEDHILITCVLSPQHQATECRASALDTVTIVLCCTVSICIIFGSFIHGVRQLYSGVYAESQRLSTTELNMVTEKLNHTFRATLNRLSADDLQPMPSHLANVIADVEQDVYER